VSKPRRVITKEQFEDMMPLKLELPGWAIAAIDEVATLTGAPRASLLRTWLIDRMDVERQARGLPPASQPVIKRVVGA
jgi:hypothetical protein